jgi:hypothetical protein
MLFSKMMEEFSVAKPDIYRLQIESGKINAEQKVVTFPLNLNPALIIGAKRILKYDKSL